MEATPRELAQTASPIGEARVRFACRDDGVTSAHDVYQRDPLRVLFPTAFDDPLPQAVIVNTAGGIVGGDRLSIAIKADAGAAARVTTPAAERAYRAGGRRATIATSLAIAADAWLEWLPNETILFDDLDLRRELTIDAAPAARGLICEMAVFGRLAHGEALTHGSFRDRWRVSIGGVLAWADDFTLAGDIAAKRAHPFVLDGANAMATILAIGPDLDLDAIRAASAMPASRVAPNLVVMRGLERDPGALRRVLAGAVAGLRAGAGWPKAAPSTWRF